MKKGLIIAGFAGIGKTTLAKKYINVIDIESSPYKWDYSGVNVTNLEVLKGLKNRKPNSEFPENYINAIKEAQFKYDIVLVWIHKEMLPYYDKNDFDYYLCFPSKEALKEYKFRFIKRGNNVDYINNVLSNYDKKYEQLKANSHKQIELGVGETLETALLKMGIELKEK